MSRKSHRRASARRTAAARQSTLLTRRLRIEPLEDRRLLAVITVNTVDDVIDFNDGRTSLREAIFAANTVAGPDEIRFDFGHDGPATILLTQGELKITDSLTITGNGAGLLTIDASGSNPTKIDGQGTRVVSIDDGDASVSLHVTLSGMTLTGGNAAGAGGAIHTLDNLVIRNVVLRKNYSLSDGGALYVGLGASATLDHCDFLGNGRQVGQGGGALFSQGPSLRVLACTFRQNAGGIGGAIRYVGPSVEITGSTFHDNRAGSGGGAAIESPAATIRDSEFSFNTATAGDGGGLYAAGSVDVQHVNFRGNQAGSGGGAIVHSGRVQFTACTFEQNVASTEGGGVGITGGPLSRPVQREVLLADCLVIQNSARDGGGIEIDEGTIQNTWVAQNSAGRFGGGIYVRGNTRVLNSTISENKTRDDYSFGGGVYAVQKTDQVSPQFVNSTFSQNRSAGFAGGLYVESPEPIVIAHCTIVANSSSYETAGLDLVTYGDGPTTAVLTHTIIAKNTRADGVQTDLRVRGDASLMHNIVGMPHGDFLPKAPFGSPDANGNLVGGQTAGVIDPLLGPLADNGGPTPTHAVLPGSPALDAGDASLRPGVDGTPLFDQRGASYPRVAGARIDIGAYEQQDVPFVVDTTVDESDGDYSRGDLSLREAIELANARPGADEVHFDFGHDGPATILLTQGELKITDSLTITGSGAGLLTIDASGNDPTPNENNGDGSRIFVIPGGAPSETSVEFSGLKLTGGDLALDLGGAIYAPSRDHLIRIVDCTLADNVGFYGGAIYSNFLEIIRSTFLTNSAAAGGAIIGGDMRIIDSTFADNHARNSGGAIEYGGAILVQGSEFVRNYAGRDGGAISAFGDLTVYDSIFQHNVAVDRGGAIEHSGGNLFVTASVIADNVASHMPIPILGPAGHPGGRGGGVYSASRDRISIVDTQLSGNQANGEGGGAYFQSGVTVVDHSTISENKSATGGGGLFVYFGNLEVRNSRLTRNSSSEDGGAIQVRSGGQLAIHDSELLQNSAQLAGGGVSFYGQALIAEQCTIACNSARYGGGVFAVDSRAVSIVASRISENSSADNGGGILAVSDMVRITQCLIDSNTAANGGGVSVASPNAIVRESTVTGNRVSARGGGIWSVGIWSDRGRIEIVGSTVHGNEAADQGGGLYLQHDAAIVNATISGNYSGGFGGGIYLETSFAIRIAHCTVTQNSSVLDGAGAYLDTINGGTIEIAHCVIAGNFLATGESDDVFANRTHAYNWNLIGQASNSGLAEAPVGAPDAYGNLIGGPIHGQIDPLLAPLANNGGPTPTHALLPSSPAIGAGDPAHIPGLNGAPEFDQRGAPFTRLAGARIDIGAYEVQAATGALRADFNLDGRVDGSDFLAWQQNLGRTSGATIRQGDATADGDVDVHDLAVWRATFDPDDSDDAGEAIGVQPSAVNQSRAGEGGAGILDQALAALDPSMFELRERTPLRLETREAGLRRADAASEVAKPPHVGASKPVARGLIDAAETRDAALDRNADDRVEHELGEPFNPAPGPSLRGRGIRQQH